jgi:hypothetical protein
MSRLAIILVAAAALASLALGLMAGRWARSRPAAPGAAPSTELGSEAGTATPRPAPAEAPAPDRSAPQAPAAAPSAQTAPADPVPPELRLDALDAAALAELADLAAAAAPPGDWPERPPDVARRALALRGAVETAASDGLGELTHPVVAARLAGEILARAGLGLTAEQWREAVRLAGEYEAAMARAEAGYGAETIRMERVLDEIDLKEDFASAFVDGLTDEQRAHLLADGRRPSFLSPLLIAEARAMPVAPGQRAELAERFAADVARSFGIPGDVASQLADRLFRDMAPLFDPAAAARLAPVERVLLAGRAQANVFEAVLRAPGVDEPARQRILAICRWVVPDASSER